MDTYLPEMGTYLPKMGPYLPKMGPYLLEMDTYLPKMDPYLLKMGPIVFIIAQLCESMHMWSCLKPVFVNPCTRCTCLTPAALQTTSVSSPQLCHLVDTRCTVLRSSQDKAR